MYKLIDRYLESTVTPERKDILVESVITLEELGHEAALDELNSVLMMQGSSEHVNTLDRINAIVDTAQDGILIQQGIILEYGLELPVKQKLMSFIGSLEYYIFPDQAELLFMGDFDNETVLVKLLDMVEGVDDEMYLLSYIGSVSDEFTDHVKETVYRQLVLRGQASEYVAPVSKIKFINLLFKTFGKENFSLSNELITSGKRIGGTLKDLIDVNYEYLDDTNVTFVSELLGLVAISDTSVELIFKTTSDEITKSIHCLSTRRLFLDKLNQYQLALDGK